MITDDQAKLLAIDTSTKKLILGVRFGGDRLVKSSELMEKSHGQLIIKKIRELLESSSLTVAELDCIVIGVGPGSFTGLRIGMAAAKGMAMALKIPIVTVTTFDVAAFRLRQVEEFVHVIVPLNRDDCIVGRVQSGEYKSSDVAVVAYDFLLDYVDGGSIAAVGIDLHGRFPEMSNEDLSIRLDFDASDLIYLGGLRLASGQMADLNSLEPHYLQKSQAEIRYEQRQQ